MGAVVQPVARLIAGKGTLFGWWGTWAYLAGLVAALAGLALIAANAAADWPERVAAASWIKWGIGVIALLAWLRLVAGRRWIAARAFEHTLLDPGRSYRLDGLHRSLDAVIDLRIPRGPG